MYKKSMAIAIIISSLMLVWHLQRQHNSRPIRQSKNTVVVGTSADYPPYSFKKDGALTGFDIEVIKRVATTIGKDIAFKNMPFNTLLIELQLGRIDVIAAGMTPTKARAKKILFTNPHLTDDPLIAVTRAPEISSTDPEQLKNKTTAVNQGYYADMYLTSGLGMSPLRLDTVTDIFMALNNGQVQVTVGAKSALEPYIQKWPNKQYNVVTLDAPTDAYAFGVDHTKKHLAGQINQALKTMAKDKTLQIIKNKWRV
jgi:ABC-type amino acid transport substrate-binding protein